MLFLSPEADTRKAVLHTCRRQRASQPHFMTMVNSIAIETETALLGGLCKPKKHAPPGESLACSINSHADQL